MLLRHRDYVARIKGYAEQVGVTLEKGCAISPGSSDAFWTKRQHLDAMAQSCQLVHADMALL